jgi:hypothetical protein
MNLPPSSLRALRALDARPGEIQEILSAPPPLLTRVGLAVVIGGLVLTCLVLGGIRYPELIHGKMVVVSSRPPVSVVANADGRVIRFFAKERATVKAQEPVLLLDNPASYEHILQAQASVEDLRNRSGDAIPKKLPPLLGLGEIQTDYAAAVRLSEELENFLISKPFDERIRAIETSIKNQEQLRSRVRSQQELLAHSAQLAVKNLSRQEELKKVANLASLADIDTARGAVLSAQARHRELDVSLAQSKISSSESSQLLAQLNQEKMDREASLRRSLREALDRVISGIDQWHYRYLLRAPIEGRLAFHEIWATDQSVRRGQEVFYVVPSGDELVGRTTVPQRGFGRVLAGQRVRVKMDGYPFEHFGLVEGRVDAISLTAKQDGHAVIVRFPSGLETTTGRHLPFTQGMSAEAEIVTEDLSLLARFFTPLRRIWTGERR